MKKQILLPLPIIFIGLFFYQCGEKPHQETNQIEASIMASSDFNGFESQIALGEHLVIIAGCNDCHTPKKMTEHGPVLDSSRWLSGHPAEMPGIDFDRAEVQKKGLAMTADLTEWIGPWGVSYAANLTPDGTGIGNWTEEQFFTAIREGKSKGIAEARSLLPPMPWEMYKHMTDTELKAVFAYLKTLKPVNNIVPAPIPPGQ